MDHGGEREKARKPEKADAIIHAREASSLDRAVMAEEMKSGWSPGEVIKTTTKTQNLGQQSW